MNNIFDTSLLSNDMEQFETILESKNLKIERIVSFGHPTPKDEWYDQTERELVFLIKGNATLVYENNDAIQLIAGDYIIIEPHVKHRVESVSYDAVWLAIFIS